MKLPFRPLKWTLLWLSFVAFGTHLHAAPLFRPNDVVAFVGGEDMVAAAENGDLELIITTAFPDDKLTFRSLAWEGDTVYEQHRDVNYPSLEQQLEKIGATVVICQFGAMESFDGQEKLTEFTTAYEKLLQRITSNGKRRAILLTPCDLKKSSPLFKPERPWAGAAVNSRRRPALVSYRDAITALEGTATRVVDVGDLGMDDADVQRDGIHLTGTGHAALARTFARQTGIANDPQSAAPGKESARLQQIIIEKNRLWFHYYRPQNWAFLAGDRTNQPSSRDHRDPSKRWFPEELEEFLPLIDQKERQIHALAQEISK